MSRKSTIPSPDVLYVKYEAGRRRVYGAPQRFEHVDSTVLVLPTGVDASHADYVDYVDTNGLASRELRNGYLTFAYGGRQVVAGDFPYIEGYLSRQHREALAARLGAVVVVLGEDLAPQEPSRAV